MHPVVSVLDQYQVETKVDFVITDNAANMRKALTGVLGNGDEEVGKGELTSNCRQGDDQTDCVEIDETVAEHSHREGLSCFDHSLHLVVLLVIV